MLKYLLKLTHDDYFATDIKERLNNPFQTLANSFNKEEYLELNLSNITIKKFEDVRNKYLIEIMQKGFQNQHASYYC